MYDSTLIAIIIAYVVTLIARMHRRMSLTAIETSPAVLEHRREMRLLDDAREQRLLSGPQ